MPFKDLTEACKGLLVTTAEVLNPTGLDYVIAGGWVPLLAEPNHPTLKHPGTRDVDVLLIDREVQEAVKALLTAGFRPSAKHEFQLLRDARVGDLDFAFNIDLMHPYEADETPTMFHDIFDLGVDDDYDPRGSRHAKSIAFRSAAIVHEQKLYSRVVVTAANLDGRCRAVEVPILSPAGAVLSKCESVSVAKRTRDAFDIYYLLSGAHGAALATELQVLAKRFPQVRQQLNLLKRFLMREDGRFDRNVLQHAPNLAASASAQSLALLFPPAASRSLQRSRTGRASLRTTR